MEQFKKNICKLLNSPISSDYKSACKLLSTAVSGNKKNRDLFVKINKFVKAVESASKEKLKFFRPQNEKSIVDAWNELSNVFELLSPNIFSNVNRENLLKMYCLTFSKTTPNNCETEAGPSTSNELSLLEIPKSSTNYYENSVASTWIRARRWIEKNPSTHSERANVVLNELAPNTQAKNGRFRHDVGEKSMKIIQAIDTRAMDLFSPKAHGRRALIELVERLNEDTKLIAELIEIIDAETEAELAKYLLKSLVHGAALSIGRFSVRHFCLRKKKPETAVAHRTGLKVGSLKKRKTLDD